MKEIQADSHQIAVCGLYCGACRKYRTGHCPGCAQHEKASWCKIRKCAREKGYLTCAECTVPVENCKTFSNFLGKVFSLLFRSDRPACIRRIREIGRDGYASEMAALKLQTIKRK